MQEGALRIALLVTVVAQSAVALASLSASKAAASVFRRRDEGIPLSLLLGAFYLGYCGGIVTYLIEPRWMTWGSVDQLPLVWRWIGMGPLIAGALLVIWGLRTLGRQFAFSVTPQQGGRLVRTGPYRWVRHPLYTAFLVQSVGISLVMASWFVGLVALLLWVLLAFRTGIEEQQLIDRFGDEYREYIAMTGRFVPRCFPFAGSRGGFR